MDTSMTQHDDLNLMGMQELDSTLSIFESSHSRDSPTAGSSNYQFENSMDLTETLSNTIIVQSPVEHYSKMDHIGGASHEIVFNETRSVPNNTQPHCPFLTVLIRELQNSIFGVDFTGN